VSKQGSITFELPATDCIRLWDDGKTLHMESFPRSQKGDRRPRRKAKRDLGAKLGLDHNQPGVGLVICVSVRPASGHGNDPLSLVGHGGKPAKKTKGGQL